MNSLKRTSAASKIQEYDFFEHFAVFLLLCRFLKISTLILKEKHVQGVPLLLSPIGKGAESATQVRDRASRCHFLWRTEIPLSLVINMTLTFYNWRGWT